MQLAIDPSLDAQRCDLSLVVRRRSERQTADCVRCLLLLGPSVRRKRDRDFWGTPALSVRIGRTVGKDQEGAGDQEELRRQRRTMLARSHLDLKNPRVGVGLGRAKLDADACSRVPAWERAKGGFGGL